MSEATSAVKLAARFEIFHTQLLDENGRVQGELPGFARDPETLREMYRVMVRTRAFDRKAVSLQRTGQLGTYAACLGQEAIGVALGLTMKPEDVLISSYRDYAAQFLRGVPMKAILQYWGGDERGMDYPARTPSYNDFAIAVPIGTHVPHGIGVAYAFHLRKQPRVAVVACGDGATSKGDFYEAISCAKLWDLPFVVLVSNNQWAISMPRERQTGAETLAQKAVAGGMPGEQVDGNDVIATRLVLERAIEAARRGEGPRLVEAITYRLHDHTTADDARRYRSEEEVKAAWARCPVKRLKIYLESQQWWDDTQEKQLADAATAEVEAATKEFLATSPQAPESLFDHLYEKLPRAYEWQREEVRAAGPKGGHH